MPTIRDEDRAKAALDRILPNQLTVERGYPGGIAIGLIALVVASALITLTGTFTAVGLAAAEGRADVSTLAAVGAGPRVRRRLAAAQAGVITIIGGALGLGTGLLAGWALVRLMGSDVDTAGSGDLFGAIPASYSWPFTVPWPQVLTISIGVPLIAIVIAFAFAFAFAFACTRSRLPLVRRLGH